MKLKFKDGTIIETPERGSVIEFLFRNYPARLSEYLAYLERQNKGFEVIDRFLQAH